MHGWEKPCTASRPPDTDTLPAPAAAGWGLVHGAPRDIARRVQVRFRPSGPHSAGVRQWSLRTDTPSGPLAATSCCLRTDQAKAPARTAAQPDVPAAGQARGLSGAGSVRRRRRATVQRVLLLKKAEREAAAQHRPAGTERKTAFFARNDRPHGVNASRFKLKRL